MGSALLADNQIGAKTMGQYHKVYNLDKKEFIHAHKIGIGLKLTEQCGPCDIPTTSAAPVTVCQ